MRARAWWWVVAWLGLAACGGATDEEETEEAEELGTLRQAEGSGGGGVEWLRFATGPGLELGSAVTQDRDGNVLTAVVFSGAVDLGTGPLGPRDPEVPGLVVVKYSPEGRLRWARVFLGGKGGVVSVSALGTDRERNVLVAGWSERSAGGGPSTLGEGAFLLKLSRSGETRWTRELKGDAVFLASTLATDRAGDVLVSGTLSEGSLDFGGRVLKAEESVGFLVRYSADGTLRWLHAEAEATTGKGVALDEAGDAYFCGTVPAETSEGTGTRPVLRRLAQESGAVRWSRSLEDGACEGVAVHGNRVVTTGSFRGAFSFQGKTYTATDADAFLAAYTLEGEERWARNFGRAGTAVAMDYRDGVLVAGHYETGERIGGKALPGEPGSRDNVFVAEFDRIDGLLRWVRGIPSTAALALDVSTTREGEGVVVGAFGGPTDFGGGTVRPKGGYDAFILRLGE